MARNFSRGDNSVKIVSIWFLFMNMKQKINDILRGGMRENIYIYIRWFITNLQETPWVDAKRNKVLLVSGADRPCWCGRNIVWNMERVLPECACTTIIDISPRIFKLILLLCINHNCYLYCCCVSIIIVICICHPGALIWLINLFLFLLMYVCIYVCIFICSCCTWCLSWINKIFEF
jgi:hypothetical protein